MSTRFITIALLNIVALTLVACTDHVTPSGKGTIVAEYEVSSRTATEFIPSGDQNALCVTWAYAISCVKKDGK